MEQSDNSGSMVRNLAALEWFVLKTVAKFSSHSRYSGKTLCNIFESVLGIRNSDELVKSICANLTRAELISNATSQTPIGEIMLYDKGAAALESGTISE